VNFQCAQQAKRDESKTFLFISQPLAPSRQLGGAACVFLLLLSPVKCYLQMSPGGKQRLGYSLKVTLQGPHFGWWQEHQ
jgi:hypothetical protein